MAKIALGEMFHVANHRDPVSRELSTIIRSAHSTGGNKAFRRCVAERTRGHGGSPVQVRQNLAAAAKACKGVRA